MSISYVHAGTHIGEREQVQVFKQWVLIDISAFVQGVSMNLREVYVCMEILMVSLV